MLNLQPAKGHPGPSQGRIGLALAGGGPLGAFYEVGCLHAIEEACDGLRLTKLDVGKQGTIAAQPAPGAQRVRQARVHTGTMADRAAG